jgi:hypothetical protein
MGADKERAQETADALLAVLRRDWDCRVLDAWSRMENGRQVWVRNYHDGGIGSHPGWSVHLVEELCHNQHTVGVSANTAREAAARAVYPTLPEAIRAELGERP